MTIKIQSLGDIRIAKAQELYPDEYKILDIESLFKIEEAVGFKIAEAYISEYDGQSYLVVDLEIPETIALLCDTTRVFEVAEILRD